ncbi:MAG: stage II sporulation protein P [Clostridia bacterium]|nr:stage II sporulation protein P [Clostridia bacterium]
MKKLLMVLLAIGLIVFLTRADGDVGLRTETSETEPGGPEKVWRIITEDGDLLTSLCGDPSVGDQYIAPDNRLYEIVELCGDAAVASCRGEIPLPDVSWLDKDGALPVTALTHRIALYCTHSDESYEPSDGYYSTDGRGSIYEVAQTLAAALEDRGIHTAVSDTLHHPHDAGAYRRSRQTAVKLLTEGAPDCLLDIHRDGIPDPDSYAVTLGGKPASKVRLLVGRGNQNAEVNKAFALLVKAVADRVYPGLIKDIYLGRGAFNQDLFPRSLLLECGTYTLEKAHVLYSMGMLADVLDRALYGGVTGAAGRTVSDAGQDEPADGAVVMGEPDAVPKEDGSRSGLIWTGAVLILGLVGYGILSAGSLKGGIRKAGRGLREMTGGLVGKRPSPDEDPQHSGK